MRTVISESKYCYKQSAKIIDMRPSAMIRSLFFFGFALLALQTQAQITLTGNPDISSGCEYSTSVSYTLNYSYPISVHTIEWSVNPSTAADISINWNAVNVTWYADGELTASYTFSENGNEYDDAQSAWFDKIDAYVGYITGPSSVCYNGSGSFSLTGTPSDDVTWQKCTSGCSVFDDTGWTETTNSFSNLTQTTKFRAKLNYTGCGSVYSNNTIQVIVYPEFNQGTIVGGGSGLCSTQSIPLTEIIPASGGNGSISYQWQVNTGSGFVDINGAGADQASYTIPANTIPAGATYYYQRLAKPQSCPSSWVASNTVSATTYASLYPGSLPPPAIICYGASPSLITPSAPSDGGGGYAYSWHVSNDGTNWSGSFASTASYDPPENITSKTYYKRVVTSSCGFSGYSTTYFDPVTTAPGSISNFPATGCYPSGTSGTFTISGNSGAVVWQKCTSNCTIESSWIGASVSFSNLTESTEFRAKLVDEICGIKYTPVVKININPGSPTVQNVSAEFGASVTLSAGGAGTGETYRWRDASGQITSNLIYTPSLSNSATTYTVSRYNSNTTCETQADQRPSQTLSLYLNTPPSPSVSSNLCGPKTVTMPSPPGGVTYYWQGIVENGQSTAIPLNPEYQVGTSGNYFIRSKVNNMNLWSPAVNINVSVINPAAPLSPTVSSNTCGPKTLSKNGGEPSGVIWYWQGVDESGQDYTSSVATASSYQASINGTNIYYIRARTSSGCWSPSTGVSVAVTITPSAPAIANNAGRFGDGPITISTNEVSGATGYKWYLNASPLSGQVSSALTINNLAATTAYQVSALNNSCESSMLTVTAYHEPLPVINSTRNGYISMAVPVELSLAGTYPTYLWKNSVGQSLSTSASYTTAIPDVYIVTVTKANIQGSAEATYTVRDALLGQNENYIVTNNILIENVTDLNAVKNLTVNSRSEALQYFDGLGRPMQSVVTQASPNKQDIVQPVVYDAYGREAKKYLPIVAGTDGWYKPNDGIIDAQTGDYTGIAANFYDNPATKIADDQNKPFAETVFEASPLNRILKQGSPGQTWQPDLTDPMSISDKTVKKRYETNGATDVLLFKYTQATGLVTLESNETLRFYSINQLYANKTLDEHNNEVIEYVDKQGRTVCKKVQYSTTGAAPNLIKLYAATYYVYDDFGNLVIVLPPEACKDISSFIQN